MFDKPEDPIMIETPEEVLQIRLQHPADHAAGDDLIEGRQGVMGAELRPAAERAGQEVLLVDGGQHLSRGALERPVGDGWNAERALLRLARLCRSSTRLNSSHANISYAVFCLKKK